MNRSVIRNRQAPRWIALATGIAIAVLSTATYAEYRCARPEQLTVGETRACELARQDSPDALIHFINRTQGVYNLYVNDYVSKADANRWEEARHKTGAEPTAVAKAKGDAKGGAAPE